jgi:hypothetical protein
LIVAETVHRVGSGCTSNSTSGRDRLFDLSRQRVHSREPGRTSLAARTRRAGGLDVDACLTRF